MNLPPTNRTRLHVDAEIEIEEIGVQTSVPELTAAEPLILFGRVVNARSGAGLSGLRMIALSLQDGTKPKQLGTASSGNDGWFRINFQDTPGVVERMLSLRYLRDSSLTLRVETSDGDALMTSGPITIDRNEIEATLPVQVAAEQTRQEVWSVLGKHLLQVRIARLNAVVKVLGGEEHIDGENGKPVELSMLTRQSMLGQLEQTFLDPSGILLKKIGDVPFLNELQDPKAVEDYAQRVQAHQPNAEVEAAFSELLGKAASFASLAEVDWTIDPAQFMDGNISGAVNKFRDQYINIDAPRLLETDLMLYRDYLLAIWTTSAVKIVYVAPQQLTVRQAISQLETRFHQKFTTYDDKPRIANAVLIPILTAILTSPTGKGFGFGIAAGSIVPQGTQTPRAFLDYLIGLSKVSAEELGFRYRLDFTRPDAALSSPVQENIAALQGFLRDNFECDLDPFDVDPDIHHQPIIPDKWIGNAPFFLYYDEWLRQQAPFYPENHLDIRLVLPVDLVQQARDQLAAMIAGKVFNQKPNIPVWKFCQDVIGIWDVLQVGHAHFYAGEYGLAKIDYELAAKFAAGAMQENILQGLVMTPLFNKRKNLPLNSMKDLAHFMDPRPELAAGGFGYTDTPDWARDRMALRLAYYTLFTIPVCRGDAEFALGDYEHAIFHYGQATRFEVGIARETDSGGYRPTQDEFQLYSRGDKPYTVRLPGPGDPAASAQYFREQDDEQYDETFTGIYDNPVETYAAAWARRIPHLAEMRYCRLRQANVMLEWADALYRLNDPTSMARARELYKGVLWIHGKIPPICPAWSRQYVAVGHPGDKLFPSGVPSLYMHHTENPAIVSQTLRGYRGIFQIDHGLNYFGEHDNIVPILRYRPLKNAADRTAAMARGAQQDFLAYTEHVEAAMTARLQLANFLQKAKLQSAIADELHDIAVHDVAVAQDQATAVEAAIKAKKDEIASHDSLFGQIGDAIKGVKSIFADVPDDTKSAVGAGIKSEATGDAMVGEGMLGLGAAGSVMTGFGIFAVVGYVTLSGMADAATQRAADLHTLTDKALPAAQAAVAARQHGVTITQYQKQLAQADIDMAQTLLAFEQNKTLNQNFWLQLSQVARRLMRRYLEMGARMTWLSERALAYEQDRELRIVRMDYFPAQLQGVTGADLMQADLAELDATRIEGMKRTVPVRRTLSLAREFPLHYGQLKMTGRCSFRTEEAFFRKPYPGTSAYRIRAVTVEVQQVELSQPLRGSLINRGISISKPLQPNEHVLVRPSESLPLSEFRLEKDMGIYGLPNETLLTFEGSSIETFWELSLPKAANASGLDGMVDVLLTFDLFAEYAPERYEADLAALPVSERKWIFVSAAKYQPAAVLDLAGAAKNVDIAFDIRRLRLLARQESSRKIKNAAMFVVSPDAIDFTAKLLETNPAGSITIAFKDGFVISSLQPDPAMLPMPPSPLNALADLDPEQAFTLSISKAANPGADFSRVTDVVLAIEYEASLV